MLLNTGMTFRNLREEITLYGIGEKKKEREKGYLYCDIYIFGKTEFSILFFLNLWVKLSRNTKIIFAEKSQVKIISFQEQKQRYVIHT